MTTPLQPHPGHHPVTQLNLYPHNPRQSDIKAIISSLKRLGQYKPIVVNAGTHTGRPNEVLAGNHTLLAARHLGWDSIQTVTIDVDEETAARIVAADNRTADLGGYDNALLAGLLNTLPDLEGTGYTDTDLDDLLAAVEEAVTLPETAEEIGEGMVPSASFSERATGFELSGVRSIVLAYSLEEFSWMVRQLGLIGERTGLEAHSDIVKYLVQKDVDA